MNYSRPFLVQSLIGLLLLAIIAGCGGADQSDPKKTVISMFGAMERDDQAALAHILDLAELMRDTDQDYALNTENPRVWTSPQDLLNDMTGDGLTKQRWFSYQRIINETKLSEGTATVEVTFVDKEESKGYRTLFGLHQVDGKWKIYSFKTLAEGS